VGCLGPADCPIPANGTPTCADGACGIGCSAGYADCDGDPATGCEANVATDVDNCGACGNGCPGATDPCQVAGCVDGACGLSTEADGTPCAEGKTCRGGVCTSCTPTTCAELYRTICNDPDACGDYGICGPYPDGCGGTLDCGNCGHSCFSCENGICVFPPGKAVCGEACCDGGCCFNAATGQCSYAVCAGGSCCPPGYSCCNATDGTLNSTCFSFNECGGSLLCCSTGNTCCANERCCDSDDDCRGLIVNGGPSTCHFGGSVAGAGCCRNY
jgi:hypothetical protein